MGPGLIRVVIASLVLCNRYDFPIVEFKMARRQGATREHVLCDLQPRSNAGAGPFSTQPFGPQFFGRISEKISLGQYRKGYRCFACSLKFAQTPCGDWQTIPVTTLATRNALVVA